MSTTSERRTGRTTRMLEAAIEAARQGQKVLVIGANEILVADLRQRAQSLGASAIDLARITFESSNGLEEGRHRSRRFHKAFEDHYATELRALQWHSHFVRPLLSSSNEGGNANGT